MTLISSRTSTIVDRIKFVQSDSLWIKTRLDDPSILFATAVTACMSKANTQHKIAQMESVSRFWEV